MFLLLSSVPRIGPNGASPNWLPPEPYNPSTGESLFPSPHSLHEIIVRPRIYRRPKIDPSLLKEISDLLWKKQKLIVDHDFLEEILEELLGGTRTKQELKIDPKLLKEILEKLNNRE